MARLHALMPLALAAVFAGCNGDANLNGIGGPGGGGEFFFGDRLRKLTTAKNTTVAS